MYCTEIAASMKPTCYFFLLYLLQKHKQAQKILGNHPFPRTSLSSRISCYPPHHLGNLLILILFSAIPWCSRGISCSKKHQLCWLTSYLLTWIQMHSSLPFSITAGTAAFLTPSSHALQGVLLHCSERTGTALYGHPEHQSFNIQVFHTKNIGAAKKNPFGLRIFNHLRE